MRQPRDTQENTRESQSGLVTQCSHQPQHQPQQTGAMLRSQVSIGIVHTSLDLPACVRMN